jgi:SPP1 gp7 family putative phage head morphogenesis protein
MAAINANTALYDKSVDRAAMIRLYERRLNGKVTVILNGHKVRVVDLISRASLSPKGFETLREAVDLELQKTFKEVHNVTSVSLLDLVGDQISYTYQNIENVLGKVWTTKKPQRRIAEEIVLKNPLFNNRTLLEGWIGVSMSERKRIEMVIRRGMAEGKSVSDIALMVRKGNVFNITMNQSKALVITSMTSVHAQVDQAVYAANSKALLGWQYVAVLDSRTTPLCSHRDGTIYPPEDTAHLPPAHYYCRSHTIPVTKSWEDLSKLEGIAQIRKRNLAGLSEKQIKFYDGQTPMKESYNEWLLRQPTDVQLRHLGDFNKLEIFRSGQLTIDKFTNPEGNSIGIRELRQLTNSGYALPGDTRRFALAKEKLDTIKLGASSPDDFISDKDLAKSLEEFYLLQAGELDGTLSFTNFRGNLLHTKRAQRQRVLSTPPTEDNMIFNPITGRYEDNRMFQPNLAVLENNIRLVEESNRLLPKDKEFIKTFIDKLEDKMGVNERAVVTDNLRIIFGHYRAEPQPWLNFKAVTTAQMKFDVMNVSDYIETQLRKDSNLLHKLKQDNYLDPVLGPVQLQDLHDTFLDNIVAKNKWEDKTAPKIAKELRNILDYKLPVKLKNRIQGDDIDAFYLRFAQRLSLADSPDRDQLAISLGRDLFNMANYRGSRNEWYKVGLKILDDAKKKGFYELETFGVQKRRMKSRLSSNYFGPYYDTFSVNLRIVDPRIQEYANLTRKVDVGLRVSVVDPKNRLVIREGYKTYFIDRGLFGYEDTRIPITSTSSFSDFPVELVDKQMEAALNWTAKTKYKIDKDFYDFTKKLMYFEDDKGKAQYFHDLNEYREFIIGRGDAYERFKAMEWLTANDYSFSNTPFLDHRARIYERGLIGPQSGETFRPFLSTAEEKAFSPEDFYNLQDQIGSFLGGLTDTLEGSYNSLSITGRQKIAIKWREDLVKIGNHMLRGKPQDVRDVLESRFLAEVDGEEQGKVLRFALEMAKLDQFLGGDYSKKSLAKLTNYKTALALEQDASSSGAQIIALTTKNKQLAQLSNVVPTNYKKRLYDEIAASTFNDPRFRELNIKLGLTEKDLRKAAKAQNMVTFYGAGERTGILNVEGKLAKSLDKQDGVLVVRASDRDTVLSEISARMARYETLDPEIYEELKALRQDVKDIFNKGLEPGADIIDQLYFLDNRTRDLVEKLSQAYDKVVTPDDFATIAKIMSENLREQVPILKDFTKYFGRLAEEYLATAKPSESSVDLKEALLKQVLGVRNERPPSFLDRVPGWHPNSGLSKLIYGIREKKLPKRWTSVPWVNFDGKIIEQNFTQTFEERLRYQDKDGKWITNIIQVPQKTDPTWWEEFLNKADKINDIADAGKARTAFAVNGNHSNDATLVKQFHLWGMKNDVPTSTVHDAFFTNTTDMLKARAALRQIYSNALNSNVIKATLDEMYARGLPREVYYRYLNEAIDIGLIPVVGRSRVGGKLLTDSDILTNKDIMKHVPEGFFEDFGFYGVG